MSLIHIYLAGDVRTNRHSERLAERGADGWSCLDDNVLGRVVQRRPNLVRLILFIDRARRADNDALPTAYAGDLVKVLLKRTGDVRIKAALVRADDADALPFGAGRDAAAAKDALVVVADHVDRGIVLRPFKMCIRDSSHTA